MIYSINTSSFYSKKITPFEIVFGPRSRCDINIRQALLEGGIVHEEDLPQYVIDELEEYENQANVVEVAASLNGNNSLVSLNLKCQTSLDLTLPTTWPSKYNMSFSRRKKQRTGVFSNEQIKLIDTSKSTVSKGTFYIIVL